MDKLPTELLQDIFNIVINNKKALNSFKNLFFTSKKINNVLHGIACKFLYQNQIEVPDNTTNFNCWLSCNFSVCTFCTKSVKKSFFNEKYTVCHSCRYSIQIISLTSCKKSYKLTEEDLKCLPNEQVKNNYNRSSYITLFLKKDVENLSYKVHGSKEKLKELQDKSIERSNKLKLNKLKVEQRKTFIINTLSDNGFSFTDINSYSENHELFQKYIKTGIPKPENKFLELIHTLSEYITKQKNYYTQIKKNDYKECAGCLNLGSIKCEYYMCKNCCKTCNYHKTLLLKKYF